MRFPSFLRRFFPATSQSVDGAKQLIKQNEASLSDKLDTIIEEQQRLFARIEQADNGINGNLNAKTEGWIIPFMRDINQLLESHDARNDLMFWQIYRKEDESDIEARRRFFAGIPKATGNLRLMQLGCAQLLREFDSLCHENGLTYWLAFGTLLGAVRHGGFIPWDDDMDLGMMRNDIERLEKIVANDSRFKVSVVFDSYVCCKQVRFMYVDSIIPCFLDLFIFDYASDSSDQLFSRQLALREKLRREMEDDENLEFWRQEGCINASDDRAPQIGAYFDKTHKLLKEEGVISSEETDAIIWGFDNMNLQRYRWICGIDEILPLSRVIFEGINCPAPNECQDILSNTYGDIYSLPKDIVSHFRHVDLGHFADEETRKKLEHIIDEAS